jgi:chromate transporter
MSASGSVLLQLAALFAPLSLVSVGGGQSVIADMHRQVVEVYGWMNESQFMAAYAIARMCPGPSTLVVTLIGWHVAGWSGAAVATLAMFGPSSALVCGLAHLWSRHKGAHWQRAVERGLTPVAAGTILATGYTLLRAAEGGWLAISVALTTAIILLFTRRVHPLLLVAAGAGLFLVLD